MKTFTMIAVALSVVSMSVFLSSTITVSTNASPLSIETSTNLVETNSGSSGEASLQDDPTEGAEYGDDEYEDSADESSARDYKQEAQGNATIIEDYFGNVVKVGRNHTTLQPSKARNLILKTILLGPLIGVTIKSALFRGVLWALLAYVLNLFFPSLLSSLGLGSGLVGFSRQFTPSYMQMLVPQLTNLPGLFINAISQSTRQQLANYTSIYSPYLNPVVQTISSIPEESCRFRAICEAASYIAQSSPFMSSSLQRLSATAYVNIGTDYSKAWLDGVIRGDCAAKYASCQSSPLKDMAARFASSLQDHAMGATATTGPSVAATGASIKS